MPHPSLTRRAALAATAAATVLGALVPAVASASPAASPGVDQAARPSMAAAASTRQQWINSTIAGMTLQEKVGQLFIQQVYGSSATTARAENTQLYGVATGAEVVQKYHLGGVIYFAWTDSVNNPEQIAALSNGLQDAALSGDGRRVPLQVAVDQEQGVVTRIGPPATQFPGSMALGAGRRTADARTAAGITGRELRAMGINTNFAPDADVNVNPLNPVIGTRSFSSRPTLASSMVAAQVAGLQDDGNVASAGKHFPGHGDTATDSHVAFPVITHTRAQWEKLDAPPFRAAIAQGIDMIMTAHLNFPALDDSGDPATLSRPIMTDLLRDELGYEGVIVTDSLEMQGVRDRYGDAEVAVRALEAGVDQLLMTPAMDEAYNAVIGAVRSGRISQTDLRAKLVRVLALKYDRDIASRPYADTTCLECEVGTTEALDKAQRITDRTTTMLRNDDAVLPMAVDAKQILVTGYGDTTTATLGAALDRQGADSTVLATGAAPTAAQVSAAVAATEGKDAVVVTTMKAWDTTTTDPAGGQQALVAQLLATGVPVIVVATRDPYDIAYLGAVPTYLATYSYSPVAIESAARVITGQVEPQGKLPVVIPNPATPGTPMFAFGAGLGW